jgi:hypothetical protein
VEVIVSRLEIETWIIGKDGTKWREWKRGEEEMWGLLNFVAIICVRMYLCCCSGGCLYQGLQGSGVLLVQ